MKRILVWMTLVAILFTVMPLASAEPAYAYSKDDVMAAVSGMKRMPANYYNAAGLALSVSPTMGAAKAKEVTQKLYTLWAFLSAHAYTYSGNASIANALTDEQLAAASAYLIANRQYFGAEATDVLWDFLRTTKGNTLVKPGIPHSLLGVKFDAATKGGSATVKVYTTAAAGEVWVSDTKGKAISNVSTGTAYNGTFASFKEYILTVNYATAGKNAVQIHGVDAADSSYYLTTTVDVKGPAATGTTGINRAAVVSKVKSNSVPQGTASSIQVTTSSGTGVVKITNSKGTLLAFSDEPTTVGASSKVFTLSYCFPSAGNQSIRAYAGTESGGAVLWNKTYKTATVKVSSAASGAKISKATAASVMRGQELTVRVTTSTGATRVQLLDASNELVDFKAVPTSSTSKTRTFELKYTTNKAGSHKLYVQAGNAIGWNSAKKTVIAKVLAPTVSKLTATKVLRGKPVTISGTTTAATATHARLVDANGNPLQNTTPAVATIVNQSFSFTWDPKISGKKVVYAQVNDGIGWSAKKAVTVYFLNPGIKVSATKARRGTPSTITVRASETVVEVQLYDSKKRLVQTVTERNASNYFMLKYTASTKGKKTVYLRFRDGIGWSGYVKGSITFT